MSTTSSPLARSGAFRIVAALLLALALVLAIRPAAAQEALPERPVEAVDVDAGSEPPAVAGPAADADPVSEAASTYVPMAPTEGKGMPIPGALGFQEQYSQDGEYALWMHNAILLPLVTIISLFVLGLLLWVVVRYNRRRNTVPSKTTHNTTIEVIWTLVPVLILVAIAIPSITLLARQYETPPKDAITVKATGYQWYWGYTYPDHGGFEIISNMLDEEEAIARGEPPQLAADNRMVVPAGVPIRLQTTAADVIHAFAVPSLWFKIDAVPGRINERLLVIEEPGVYYGQCSELCGARHGYMPIAVEALPMDEWRAWVRAQGGTFPGEAEEASEAAEGAEEGEQTLPEAAPLQEPESGLPDAPGAGAPPTEDTSPTT